MVKVPYEEAVATVERSAAVQATEIVCMTVLFLGIMVFIAFIFKDV